jgi:antirestriction protein ArdC
MSDKLYNIVTDRIIAALEAGAQPWRKPWQADGKASGAIAVRPLRENGVPYTGINTVNLWLAAASRGFTNPYWFTWNKCAEMGASVKKGARSEMAFFVGRQLRDRDGAPVAADEADGDGVRAVSFLRYYNVFNACEIDNLPAKYAAASDAPAPAPVNHLNPEAAQFIAATGATITYGSHRACYSPARDAIEMPSYDCFDPKAQFYSTAFHELVHWTKADARLARDCGKVTRWGDAAYAMEELVAELGAAYLCADHGLANCTEDQSAAYLASWLKVLKADNRAIFKAASWAEKAAGYLNGLAVGAPAPAPIAPARPAPAPVAPEPAAIAAMSRPARAPRGAPAMASQIAAPSRWRSKLASWAERFRPAPAPAPIGAPSVPYAILDGTNAAGEPAALPVPAPAPVATPAQTVATPRPTVPAPAAPEPIGNTERLGAALQAIADEKAAKRKARRAGKVAPAPAPAPAPVATPAQTVATPRPTVPAPAAPAPVKPEPVKPVAPAPAPVKPRKARRSRPVSAPAPVATPAQTVATARPTVPAPAVPAPAAPEPVKPVAPAPAPVKPRKGKGRRSRPAPAPSLAESEALAAVKPASRRAQHGSGLYRERLAQDQSLSRNASVLPAPTIRDYDSFIAALAIAKAGACRVAGMRWAIKPGASVLARVPSRWVACKVFNRTSRAPRDMRLPAAKFWPGSVLPAGADIAPDAPRETGPIVFGAARITPDFYLAKMGELGWSVNKGAWSKAANDAAPSRRKGRAA